MVFPAIQGSLGGKKSLRLMEFINARFINFSVPSICEFPDLIKVQISRKNKNNSSWKKIYLLKLTFHLIYKETMTIPTRKNQTHISVCVKGKIFKEASSQTGIATINNPTNLAKP